jgi:hypothetical protein
MLCEVAEETKKRFIFNVMEASIDVAFADGGSVDCCYEFGRS